MKPDFDYSEVPYQFAHCLNSQCPQANDCLRFLITKHIPVDVKTITVVSPRYGGSMGKEPCSYFMPDQTVTLQRGITHLYDKLPYSSAVAIRRTIIRELGKNLYYRIRNKERFITPQLQNYILQLFRDHGITEAPQYDESIEMYDWP